jgi:4'-phosphopantetheinyl transferase
MTGPAHEAPLPGETSRLHPCQGVVVRRFDLAAPAIDPAWAESVLSPEEEARAARLVRAGHAARFRAARALLRACLAEVVGGSASNLALETTAGGKPGLAVPGPSFNVSHSGDRLLVAVSEAGEVGVDVELWPTARDRNAVARYACTEAEAAAIGALDGALRARAILRVWTAKEAALKAIGVGLALPMRTLSLASDGISGLGLDFWRPCALETEHGRIALVDLSLAGDVACLALRHAASKF